jgi:hypothetical protein
MPIRPEYRTACNGEHAQMEEARLLLRYAANELSDIERTAADGFARDYTQRSLAKQDIGWRRGAIYYAQHRAFRKMRARLVAIGIHSTEQIL